MKSATDSILLRILVLAGTCCFASCSTTKDGDKVGTVYSPRVGVVHPKTEIAESEPVPPKAEIAESEPEADVENYRKEAKQRKAPHTVENTKTYSDRTLLEKSREWATQKKGASPPMRAPARILPPRVSGYSSASSIDYSEPTWEPRTEWPRESSPSSLTTIVQDHEARSRADELRRQEWALQNEQMEQDIKARNLELDRSLQETAREFEAKKEEARAKSVLAESEHRMKYIVETRNEMEKRERVQDDWRERRNRYGPRATPDLFPEYPPIREYIPLPSGYQW